MSTYQGHRTSLDIDALIENHREGYSLAREFYLSPEIFEEEFIHLFSRQWQYTDHISRIPHKGDYFLFQIAGEEIIIIRGEGDTVYAHYNVCRHRGSRVCLEAEGHVKRLVCPYHAWSYRLDGSLASARAMPEGFDKSQFGLKACQVRVFEGLIFINLSPEGARVPDFDQIAEGLLPWIARAELRHTKILDYEAYRAPVNWKIALENYFECYHCVTSHPEFCTIQLHSLRSAVGTKKASATFAHHNAQWEARAKALGHQTGSIWGNFGLPDAQNYDAQGYYAERMLLHHDLESAYAKLKHAPAGKKGVTVPSKLLGRYKEDDKGQVDWGIMPSVFLYTSCTITVLMRLTPLAPLDTHLSMTWLVHEEAEEGRDYNIESATWLDRVTMRQDDKIIRDTQAGVNSRIYTPGPYATLEAAIMDVHHDYLRRLRYGRASGNSTALALTPLPPLPTLGEGEFSP